jgi:hypothetical protein
MPGGSKNKKKTLKSQVFERRRWDKGARSEYNKEYIKPDHEYTETVAIAKRPASHGRGEPIVYGMGKVRLSLGNHIVRFIAGCPMLLVR